MNLSTKTCYNYNILTRRKIGFHLISAGFKQCLIMWKHSAVKHLPKNIFLAWDEPCLVKVSKQQTWHLVSKDIRHLNSLLRNTSGGKQQQNRKENENLSVKLEKQVSFIKKKKKTFLASPPWKTTLPLTEDNHALCLHPHIVSSSKKKNPSFGSHYVSQPEEGNVRTKCLDVSMEICWFQRVCVLVSVLQSLSDSKVYKNKLHRSKTPLCFSESCSEQRD